MYAGLFQESAEYIFITYQATVEAPQNSTNFNKYSHFFTFEQEKRREK